MKNVNPYLNFPGNTEEAFGFYRSVFGGEFPMVLRFRDFGPEMDGPDGDKLAHIALPLGHGSMLMGTDALESHGRTLTMGNNFSISLEAETSGEAERLFGALSAGGRTDMPLGRTEWAELYGMCTDRYGVQWMVNFPGSVRFGGSAGE
jgi:PhnB protein